MLPVVLVDLTGLARADAPATSGCLHHHLPPLDVFIFLFLILSTSDPSVRFGSAHLRFASAPTSDFRSDDLGSLSLGASVRSGDFTSDPTYLRHHSALVSGLGSASAPAPVQIIHHSFTSLPFFTQPEARQSHTLNLPVVLARWLIPSFPVRLRSRANVRLGRRIRSCSPWHHIRPVGTSFLPSARSGEYNTFPEFAKTLQTARNTLSSAGSGFTISDSILKNHLLFHSHTILRLRVCGQQSFPYATVKVDTLIATMSSAWASLIAEGIIRVPRVYNTPTPLTIPAPASTSTSLPTPPPSSTAMLSSTSRPFLPLTHADKEALRAAGGCYHCRKTPQTPGWVKHRSDSCPGDAALGIPPRSASAVVAAVGPVGFSSTYEEGYSAVAVVMPAYNPEEDDYSSGSDDNDLSRSY
ncbi:hypothetical protein C8R47DRAFT_1318370 [Mycena vitilis]|nr:hypothetical protein C8R47DRAFT_1318370 [Mycena vitilis]